MDQISRIAAAAALAIAMLPPGAASAAPDDPAAQFVSGVQAGLLDGAGVVNGLDRYGGVPHASSFGRRNVVNMAGVLDYCLKRGAVSRTRSSRVSRSGAADDAIGAGFERVADVASPDGAWRPRAPAAAAAVTVSPQVCRAVLMSARPLP
jgi:hypothetical protein